MTQLPNIITLLRIADSLGLLLCDVTSVAYWIIYALCGISDIADGWLARKLRCVTMKGALLDSLADICFVACCAWKLLPILELPQWLWLLAGESAFGTCDVRVLLLPSHSCEQVGGVPAIHCSTHNILVYRPHHHCSFRRHVCSGSRRAFHKDKK